MSKVNRVGVVLEEFCGFTHNGGERVNEKFLNLAKMTSAQPG